MLIDSHLEGHILTLTINRPQALNALNAEVIQSLSAAIDAAESDASVRAIILTGAGEKAFVAGADIKEFADFSPEEGQKLAARGQRELFDKVEGCTKPVVAAINGFALGGGLELAMAAHVRIASDNARMGVPEVSLGVIPGYGGTQRLPQLVGKGKAMELILTARMMKADEAAACGLVNQVTTQEELLGAATKMAQAMTANAPTALTAALGAVLAGYKDGVDGFAEEVRLFGKQFGTNDFKEGTTAFIEKRKAEFPGS